MREADLEAVKALSDQVHTKYPERIEVLAEKQRLFPTGCFILENASKLVGYCLSHPWNDGMPPRLDTYLGEIPVSPKTYFLHDITLAKKFRGRGFAREVLHLLSSIARMHGIAWLTLVSVYDTAPFWKKNGFAMMDSNNVQKYVKTAYGQEALAMKKPVM
jgi:GNAT superfamily N-acetyltransferase